MPTFNIYSLLIKICLIWCNINNFKIDFIYKKIKLTAIIDRIATTTRV